MSVNKQDIWIIVKVMAFFVAVVWLFSLLVAERANADELAESIVLDAELESGDFMLGTVGDDAINVQKQGDTTMGYVGDDKVYLNELEIGDWKWTTGTVGDKSINVQVWGDDDDD